MDERLRKPSQLSVRTVCAPTRRHAGAVARRWPVLPSSTRETGRSSFVHFSYLTHPSIHPSINSLIRSATRSLTHLPVRTYSERRRKNVKREHRQNDIHSRTVRFTDGHSDSEYTGPMAKAYSCTEANRVILGNVNKTTNNNGYYGNDVNCNETSYIKNRK